MLVPRGNHPDVARFKDEVFPVSVVVHPVGSSTAGKDQPGLVVVMEVLLAGWQGETAL